MAHSFEQEVFTDSGEFILKVVANTVQNGVTFAQAPYTIIDEVRQGNYNHFINRARDWLAAVDPSEPAQSRWEAMAESGSTLYSVTANVASAGVAVVVSGIWLDGQHNSRLYHQLEQAQFFLATGGVLGTKPESTQVMMPLAYFTDQIC